MWYVHDGETIIFFDEYYKAHELIRNHVGELNRREAMWRRYLPGFQSQKTWSDVDAQDVSEIVNCLDAEGTRIGFPVRSAEKKVIPGILLVQALIQRGNFFISDRCTHARVEIPSYRSKPVDKTTKEEPVKEKDDTVDAIRMACWMELRRAVPYNIPRALDKYPSSSVFEGV
jgi:hypothetical protein